MFIKTFVTILALIVCFKTGAAQTNRTKPRARDLGIAIGSGATGPHNAITDVAGVRVGDVESVELEDGGRLLREQLEVAGRVLATNHLELTILPQRRTAPVKDRQVWVEVGYDLEEFITDGFAGEIQYELLGPEGVNRWVVRIDGGRALARSGEARTPTATRSRLSISGSTGSAAWPRRFARPPRPRMPIPLVASWPFHETGYRALISALEARGNVAEALLVYEQLRCLLRDELGIVPSGDLQEHHQRLLLQRS